MVGDGKPSTIGHPFGPISYNLMLSPQIRGDTICWRL